VRAFSIVNIHLIRERAAFRSRSQAAISDSRRAPAEIDMQRYFKVSPPSVHQMVLTLRRHGIPPAPERKRTTTWAEFIRTHLTLPTSSRSRF
jgi:hypothetical protein